MDRQEWLDQVVEETLEPDLPICDPHHHNWDFRNAHIPYHRYLLHEIVDDILMTFQGEGVGSARRAPRSGKFGDLT